jgi:4-hydroxy-3-polyprenylbenzoate decarboxylase
MVVPAEAEFILEGWLDAEQTALEGPYGDHTGYYTAIDRFPVIHITALSHRDSPIYLSTFTGRAPDEPSTIAMTLNELFLPLLRQTLTEVVDCWLPPEACSYRVAVLSIRKSYPEQARRVMMGFWSLLPQFVMTKVVIVVDDDINAREWSDVVWAIATRMDPSRDLLVLPDTPMDPLDFASPAAGPGGQARNRRHAQDSPGDDARMGTTHGHAGQDCRAGRASIRTTVRRIRGMNDDSHVASGSTDCQPIARR